MTVSINEVAVIPYVGNNTVSAFAITFPTFQDEDIEVWAEDDATALQTLLVLGADYTLTNIGVPNTNGQVDLIDVGQAWMHISSGFLDTGYRLLIKYNTNSRQSARLRNFGKFASIEIEKAIDRFTMNIKAIRAIVLRSLRISDKDATAGVDPILPEIAGNPDLIVQVNATGDGFALGPSIASLASIVLPPGGAVGDVLDKASAADGDVQWNPHAYAGYSNRFSETFLSTNLTDTLTKILTLGYAAPLINLVAAGSGTVREKGDPVASVLLTATSTKTADDLATVEFFRAGISIDVNTPPAFPAGGIESHTDPTPFSDDITFRADVTDDGASGGPTTVSSSRSFTFVYPYFFGAGAVGLTPAQVAALTKDVRVSTATLNKSFTTTAGQVYYFAYPASYGALTSILDTNGFETFGDWTLTTANITGLDASAVSYRIYEFNNPVIAGTTDYTFTR